MSQTNLTEPKKIRHSHFVSTLAKSTFLKAIDGAYPHVGSGNELRDHYIYKPSDNATTNPCFCFVQRQEQEDGAISEKLAP